MAWLCLALLLAGVLSGCEQHGRDEETSSQSQVPSGEAWLEVENESAETIVELNLVSADVNNGLWGSNQLGGEVILPGELFRLRQVPCPGVFDLRLVSEAGAEITEFGREFSCGTAVLVSVTAFP